MDCSGEEYGNSGDCKTGGGSLSGGLEYVKDSKGLSDDKTYKYIPDVSQFELSHLIIQNMFSVNGVRIHITLIINFISLLTPTLEA